LDLLNGGKAAFDILLLGSLIAYVAIPVSAAFALFKHKYRLAGVMLIILGIGLVPGALVGLIFIWKGYKVLGDARIVAVDAVR